VPVKESLALMGRIGPEVRLPLVSLAPENRARLEAVLREYELIS